MGPYQKRPKKAIATTAKNFGIAYNSGGSGVLEYELEVASFQLILQYSTGRFGLNKKIIKNAAAIEILAKGPIPVKEVTRLLKR